MFTRWIVSMLILSAFLVTSCATVPKHSKDVDRKHKAEPHAIFINGKRLKEFLLEESNRQLKGDQLLAAFKDEAGLDPFKPLTGFASLIGRNLEGIRENLIEEQNPTLKGDPACEQAYQEKLQWHLDHEGEVPEAFGKIVNYDVSRRSADRLDIWVGRVDVCTWFYDKEYYVEMVFYITEDKSLRAFKKAPDGTFPGTLDLSDLPEKGRKELMELMADKNWKLHAKGGSFGFITARENGVDIDKSDNLFKGGEGDCFDILFKDYPPQASEGLPDQLDYCMGRCNAKIINTAE